MECEYRPEVDFTPRINCYSPINYTDTDGKTVTIKGRLDKGTFGILTQSVVIEE